jgi:hypothetical protein
MAPYVFDVANLPGDERAPWPRVPIIPCAAAGEPSDEELLDDSIEPPHHAPAPEVD